MHRDDDDDDNVDDDGDDDDDDEDDDDDDETLTDRSAPPEVHLNPDAAHAARARAEPR